MGFLERTAAQAQVTLGEPVLDIFNILPSGVFKELAQSALIEGVASAIPLVGDKVGDVVEHAGDERHRRQQALQKRTLNSTSTVWNNKALLLARTGTRLAIFDIKQGLLRNSLGVLLWASDLTTVSGVDVPGKPGLFFEFVVRSAGQAPLTFRCIKKFLPKVQRLQEALKVARPLG